MSSQPPESLVESLRRQISACETQLQSLRQQLAAVEGVASEQPPPRLFLSGVITNGVPDYFMDEVFVALSHASPPAQKWPLQKEEYMRYGRQLIMPEIGLEGQLRLKNSAVLIVGVGGLGCPAAAYLAGAGVGTIGLIDGDTVDTSNLHRQILHNSARVGMPKVQSALFYLQGLNPSVKYVPHETRLYPEDCLDIFSQYDVILDCTDTPASRYLISDACVILGKPLVSASALRTEGQLMVLNNPPLAPGDSLGGPCYRCIFPKPPPADSVVSCGDGGILGPVVGVMGVLQALETIKLIAPKPTLGTDSDTPMDLDDLISQTENGASKPAVEPPSMLLFSAYSKPPFRSIRLRSRRQNCAACSSQAIVKASSLASGSLDYVQFCGSTSPVNVLSPSERLTVEEYKDILCSTKDDKGNEPVNNHILIDVREKVQFDLCHLDNSINIPFSQVSMVNTISSHGNHNPSHWVEALRRAPPEKPIYVVCRLGNDSQITVRKMKELKLDFGGNREIMDIAGGLNAWSLKVDPEFPVY